MPLTAGQVEVMGGGVGGGSGLHWPRMAALSLCLFDIWPERTARMKERAQKKTEWKDSERLGGCVYFMFGLNIQQGLKKKRKKKGKKDKKRAKEKREMKDRHGGTVLRMSKQKCLNDLPDERECRI